MAPPRCVSFRFPQVRRRRPRARAGSRYSWRSARRRWPLVAAALAPRGRRPVELARSRADADALAGRGERASQSADPAPGARPDRRGRRAGRAGALRATCRRRRSPASISDAATSAASRGPASSPPTRRRRHQLADATDNYFNFGLNASQLIYDFGQTNDRWDAAIANRDASQVSELTTEQQALLDGAQRLFPRARRRGSDHRRARDAGESGEAPRADPGLRRRGHPPRDRSRAGAHRGRERARHSWSRAVNN